MGSQKTTAKTARSSEERRSATLTNTKGTTQSAANLYKRVNIDECLQTDNFTVTDSCISCGHCESICPAYAIKLDDEGKPTWIKHECFMCFGCMRLCPCKAIRYGGA